jgi:uncharacterized protein with PIN domain
MVVDTSALIAVFSGEPLLTKGSDFDQTDIRPVLDP